MIRWFINNRNLFLAGLEVGKSEIKVSADSVSGETPFLVDCHLSLCVLMWWMRQEISSGASLIRVLVPLKRVEFNYHFLRLLLQTSSHLEFGFNL